MTPAQWNKGSKTISLETEWEVPSKTTHTPSPSWWLNSTSSLEFHHRNDQDVSTATGEVYKGRVLQLLRHSVSSSLRAISKESIFPTRCEGSPNMFQLIHIYSSWLAASTLSAFCTAIDLCAFHLWKCLMYILHPCIHHHYNTPSWLWVPCSLVNGLLRRFWDHQPLTRPRRLLPLVSRYPVAPGWSSSFIVNNK